MLSFVPWRCGRKPQCDQSDGCIANTDAKRRPSQRAPSGWLVTAESVARCLSAGCPWEPARLLAFGPVAIAAADSELPIALLSPCGSHSNQTRIERRSGRSLCPFVCLSRCRQREPACFVNTRVETGETAPGETGREDRLRE